MDGIFIMGVRPRSKKEVREAVREMPHKVRIEYTGIMEGYDGMVKQAPDGDYDFVGPDPYTKRNFYGVIEVRNGKARVK
jgi:hypothetical protein